MRHEQYEDGDILAQFTDRGVEVDWQDNQFDMTIEEAVRFRDWLNRVLPPADAVGVSDGK